MHTNYILINIKIYQIIYISLQNSSGGVNGDVILNRVSSSSSNYSNCFQNGSQSQPKNGVVRVYRVVQKNPTPSTSRSSTLPSSSATTPSMDILSAHSNGVLTPSSGEGADSRAQSGSEGQSGSEIVGKKKKKRSPVVIPDHVIVLPGK